MSKSSPVPTLAIYRIKREKEAEFKPLLRQHWPTLQKLALVTQREPTIWRAEGKDGKLAYVELFEWKDGDSSNVAHQTPEVMQVWEPMGPILEGLEILKVELAKL
jgi:hypothetical protein